VCGRSGAEPAVNDDRLRRPSAAGGLRAEEPGTFVRRADETLLGRQPDPDGPVFDAKEIASGVLPANPVDRLLSSSELEEQLRPGLPNPER
jgi:hypothetical protein